MAPMSRPALPLADRVAIVTGAGRRQGIGAAVVLVLAADGADVFFTSWQPYDEAMAWGADQDGPEQLLRELRALGRRSEHLSIDLADAAAPERLLAEAEARLGRVCILVNNAVHSTRDGWQALDAATLDAHYALNVRATLLLSVAFARRFHGDGGRIISLTSGQSLGPMPDELAYAATKGAIEAFTSSLAPALAPRGITVNAVNPGPTDTGWMSAELREALLPRFPFGRIGQPQDAARLIAFLASDDAAWITGQVLHSEGGFLRG
jgi:3-oxoacyl-[acyl-carrier protein] reductase